jgi:phospholipid transport system substrate-binding protein
MTMSILKMKTPKFFIKATSTIFVLLVFGFGSTPASWAIGGSADDFIREVGNEAIQSLTDKSLDDGQRKAKFREILNRTFKIQLIARFTLGANWRRATEEQKKEYIALFEDFVVMAYAARFRDYSGENFSVGKVRDINARDKLVNSKLMLKDGSNIPVHWRVRGGEGYKIIDVLVEGVSMALTQRDEFSAIINRGGGKIEPLLAALRQNTGRN